MVIEVQIDSVEALAELVRSNETIYTQNREPHGYFCEPTRATGVTPVMNFGEVASRGQSRIEKGIRIDTENQIVVANAALHMAFLQKQLFEAQFCLPFPKWQESQHVNFAFVDGNFGTRSLRQAIDLNFPHAGEAQGGNWRDWIVGMTVVLGDGTIAKSGSEAVKNVAGYDAHKLFVGSRGTLGIIAEVILRIQPRSAMPVPDVIYGPYRGTPPYMIHRVLPSDFEHAVADAGDDLIAGDRAMGTVWRKLRDREIRRFPHDWTWESNGAWSVSNAQRVYLERAKKLLDPDAKLNPGLLGIF